MLIKSKTSTLSHFLTMHALDAEKITYLLNRGEYFLKEVIAKQKVLDTLNGKVIANLFFEPSTRTRNSFEIAEKRLGAIILSPSMSESSTAKGELLIDTLHNLTAMGTSLFVIRHPDNNLAEFLATELRSSAAVAIVGDAKHSRVARSLISGLNTMGVQQIRLITPKDLVIENPETLNAEVF